MEDKNTEQGWKERLSVIYPAAHGALGYENIKAFLKEEIERAATAERNRLIEMVKGMKPYDFVDYGRHGVDTDDQARQIEKVLASLLTHITKYEA